MALDFVQRCLELANAHIRTLSKHRDFVPAERSLYFLFPWQEWWRLKKNEASRREGRRVWAWELDPPTGHGCWFNKTAAREGTEWLFKDAGMDPPDVPDIDLMEQVPRPGMPNWWCPTDCGTLDLASPLTRHCFPPDASRHTVCCVDIKLPGDENRRGALGPLRAAVDEPGRGGGRGVDWLLEDEEAPRMPARGGPNKAAAGKGLEEMIRAASSASSYSWCTCSKTVCEELLGGRVAWEQRAYTSARFFEDQIGRGLDNVGYRAVRGAPGWASVTVWGVVCSWLTDGLGSVMELAENRLPEGSPDGFHQNAAPDA